jgi:hypothetical protein
MKAFPTEIASPPGYRRANYDEGMDLRDYFAAQAMNQIGWHGDVDSLMACAKECYMIADAMMKARDEDL